MPEQIEITRPAEGVKAAVVSLITEGKIDEAIQLFQNRDAEVKQAIEEYNTKSHSIMGRPDKVRKNKSDYRTNKLPRNWQQYINHIETYFLMNNGLKWELLNDDKEQDGLQDAFKKFQDTLKTLHYDSRTRQMKSLAGAETESAKLYAIYKDDDEVKVRIVILAASLGYTLRPLFNQYGDMKAFAVGYTIKDNNGNVFKKWDIYTSEKIYHCKQNAVPSETNSAGEWIVEVEDNIIKKIPIIYARQNKAWEGVQERIERDEWLDSKNADCNEYFADPMLKMSKSVKNGLMDPKATGKVIQVGSKDDVFEYVTPPDASDMKANEKSVLKESILNGSFTPDFSYENVKGLGAISGEAITKANALGYIKRLDNMQIYDEIFERDASLIKAIMSERLFIESREKINKMELHHIYQDPSIGMSDNSEEIQRWSEIGMSDEAIVECNRNITNKKLELMRLKKKREEAQKAAEQAASASASANNKKE